MSEMIQEVYQEVAKSSDEEDAATVNTKEGTGEEEVVQKKKKKPAKENAASLPKEMQTAMYNLEQRVVKTKAETALAEQLLCNSSGSPWHHTEHSCTGSKSRGYAIFNALF